MLFFLKMMSITFSYFFKKLWWYIFIFNYVGRVVLSWWIYMWTNIKTLKWYGVSLFFNSMYIYWPIQSRPWTNESVWIDWFIVCKRTDSIAYSISYNIAAFKLISLHLIAVFFNTKHMLCRCCRQNCWYWWRRNHIKGVTKIKREAQLLLLEWELP